MASLQTPYESSRVSPSLNVVDGGAINVSALIVENAKLKQEVKRLRELVGWRKTKGPRVLPRSGQDLADDLDFGFGLEVRQVGAGRWMAQCPAHDDRGPSLQFTEKPDGKVLVCCHAGCPTEAVLSAIGWEWGHLMGAGR